ncbi:LysR family transcriptional regulator [Paenibacillus sp. JCM 10914]|uniref:LysR family transcriptional regulator n=1 Tax=Paenibacillus sp. JCM 10914 TaxID=1236974 RepID=UPI0003CC4708|nr:LysR family transcriptional regulator [Paenibacillus sp. JCM 10914]GAE07049.1 transcriptional regulator [Paenibacillus sp. JCM 10914]
MADFEWYRSFCAIYRFNSVSEAAKARMMTQPAMSQHLAALEAEVGEPLFTRTTRSMVPTERGKELYSQLAPLIESLEETTMRFQSAATPSPTMIKIGAAHEFFAEKILPQLHALDICTLSQLGTADQLLEWLKGDALDLIVTSQRVHSAGIEYVKLMEEEFVLVAPSQLQVPPLTDAKQKEEWLSAQSWISYGLELPIIRRIWREHFKKRPLLRPVHIIPNLHMILRAVEQGAGLSVVPTYLIGSSVTEGRSQLIFEELKVSNEIFMAYQTKHKHLPSLHTMMTRLRENI